MERSPLPSSVFSGPPTRDLSSPPFSLEKVRHSEPTSITLQSNKQYHYLALYYNSNKKEEKKKYFFKTSTACSNNNYSEKQFSNTVITVHSLISFQFPTGTTLTLLNGAQHTLFIVYDSFPDYKKHAVIANKVVQVRYGTGNYRYSTCHEKNNVLLIN